MVVSLSENVSYQYNIILATPGPGSYIIPSDFGVII